MSNLIVLFATYLNTKTGGRVFRPYATFVCHNTTYPWKMWQSPYIWVQ